MKSLPRRAPHHRNFPANELSLVQSSLSSEDTMTANIDLLQAALTYILGQTNSTSPAQNTKHEKELSLSLLPPPILQQTTDCTATGSLASSSLTTSPPPQTPSWNTSQPPISDLLAVGYTPAPLLTLGYGGQCSLQQTQMPPQPTTTPTTRSYSTASILPPIPTPPPTPVTRFPFPPHGYSLTMEDNTTDYNQVPLPQPTVHLPIVAPTSSPTPSPSPSPSLTCDAISHCLFQSYLHETWPQHAIRRAGSVIQDSLYEKIVSVLQGGDANSRMKQWIKRSEFFLVEKEGRGMLLAIPTKSRVTRKGAETGGKSESRGPYKLVAKLDDFYYIISSYHNNKNGHPGIRRTHGMIQKEYSYLPRTAVAKYVELCNMCRVIRSRVTKDTDNTDGSKSNKRKHVEKENLVPSSNELPPKS